MIGKNVAILQKSIRFPSASASGGFNGNVPAFVLISHVSILGVCR